MPAIDERITRPAKLFEAGIYPDKGVDGQPFEVTESDLDSYVANTKEARLRIEHAGSPFDGMLGVARDLYRKGKELFATVEIPKLAWDLIEASGAKKLSVGIDTAKKCILEVSLVRDPRVASAAIFSGGVALTGGIIEMGWGGMAASDLERAISQKITGEEWGCSVRLYESYAIVSGNDKFGGKSYSYPFQVEDGNVVLGEPTEVEQVWRPVAVPAFTSHQQPERRLESMPEFTEEQVKQIAADAAQSAADAVRTEMSAKIKDLETENTALRTQFSEKTADEVLEGMVSEGKVHPDAVEFAKAIIMSGPETAKTFKSFVEKQGQLAELPAEETEEPLTEESLTANERRIFNAVGVTPEQVLEMRRKAG